MTTAPTTTVDLRYQWLTPAEIAIEYGRCERQVRRWCCDGTLTAFGFLTYRTSNPTGNAWWIRVPRT